MMNDMTKCNFLFNNTYLKLGLKRGWGIEIGVVHSMHRLDKIKVGFVIRRLTCHLLYSHVWNNVILSILRSENHFHWGKIHMCPKFDKIIFQRAIFKYMYIGVFGVMLQNSPKKSKSPKVRLGEHQKHLCIFIDNCVLFEFENALTYFV